MMALIGGLVIVLGFIILVKFLGLVENSTKVIKIAKSAIIIVRDTNLGDHQKEIAMQQHAKELFFLFFLIVMGSVVALAIPFGIIWLMELAKLLTVDEVIDTTLSGKFIAVTTIISIGYVWLMRKKRNNPLESFVNRYSVVERSLHKLAFKCQSSQISLSDLESRLFKRELANIKINKPVFITALPRAGTTLLLELCVKTNELVSHTYRDMPFLLTPLFWDHFSRLFKQSDILRERAHGDGMMINVDSPEAFEEIIWKVFWPSRYRKDRIIPWSEPNYPDFEKFLYDHLRKIIFLRGSNVSPSARYISKNNLNIARIGYLKRIFPDSIIVVSFRDPLQHASSLLRQHRNFLKIHQEDSFACKYMEDIGHYDFGNNLRPIDFNSWLSSEPVKNTNTLLFWLQYWINTYRYLLKSAHQIKFISYDSFCNTPKRNLENFGKFIEIKNIKTLIEYADRIVVPKPYPIDINGIPSDILSQADALYMDLQKVSFL